MAKKEEKKQGSYTAADIYVLEGLDPVRKRPGMYIGTTDTAGLHHLIWEVVDNSIDEAMAGFANDIEVRILKGNVVSVLDNGRGIPVEVHKQTKKSALETVMTTLHAGGKFGGESYKVSGGLHGVGVSVVNALSLSLKAEVTREGKLYVQEYERGIPKQKVKEVGKGGRTGTKITFSPDPTIFPKTDFDKKKVIDHLRQQAYLTKGIRIVFIDEREEIPYYHAFKFDGGIKSFLDYLDEDGDKLIHDNVFYVEKEYENVGVEAAFAYNEGMDINELSFANNIHTTDGGMHLTGFRSALTRALNDYGRKEGFIKEKEDNLTGDDVREGLTTVVSVKIREPQFEGQTKARLGNTEARTAVEAVVGEALKSFLETHPNDARSIVGRALLAAKARAAAKAAKETILRKGALDGLALPGKLADCQTKKAEDAEIFIVEGDSAGGSAKQGRDRRFQAILPLRGKILNVEKARVDKILANKEIRSLVIAMGTAIAEEFDISKLRYHKIVIMTDADVDGAHIRTLLLSLFYRHFPKVIEAGHLYIATPPLYRIQSGKTVRYVYDEVEKEKAIKEFKVNANIQRYKGLGEMNPSQLWETTMDPSVRILKQITVEDAKEADKLLDILMGSEVMPRKHFIMSKGHQVTNLDL
ncbi:MAG: DNA gyrase subunit B [Candidatus Colwellbacteria bacterium RIFCSPHIGHO2_12_FULL_43_12]|uniref:DNA gyrase subunit B n=3 Tax=Candidatus Colwelliibacteriota TaxID=1817904 RepID=A0A1G1YY48_9BACT|nr:MAG: DNA gyrase subunit B [Candidatus Colwellbacteria bacterium RIFCSPHIGHO2_02_FULL_43_15]OGY58366.1 MAG: DNA gyrase subunit B [Candidatus Colwellbacteria bacterium RIFCSPHIGHO2_12_FULL_43_12]OGY61291.1 MAG: DNA gyrase subunit B [Candidatus Colwellbacteria bacterium RIFCSPLOWO2_12_FULL_43_11]